MKGKNKLILVLFAVMALVATSVGFALKQTVDTIRYANAESIPGFTAKLEGDVIFSAERVYFAVDGDNNADNDYQVRQKALTYNGYDFNPIVTNNGVEYFGDYGLTNGYDYSHKKIINNGDFAMVNDNAIYSATYGDSTVSIKEGIMITLGGYYYDGDEVKTNYPEIGIDKDNDGIIDKTEINPNVWIDSTDSGVLGEIDFGEVIGWVDKNNDGKMNIDEIPEVGAGISYVSAVQATLNGEPITIPNSRDYNNASNEDFTWFIIPSEATEGHYKISFLYSMTGFAQPVRYEFEFYLLLQSLYDTSIDVNGNDYSTLPVMSNAGGTARDGYTFYSGTTLNYPTLTFDYSRYDLEYSYTKGDETTDVDFEYDEGTRTLNVSQKLYETIEVEPYIISADITNTIVTLMFVEQGKYEFHFDYIYNKGDKVVIPQEQVPFENFKLNIYGYQLKYSKAGFSSADMTHLDIYQNGTMFILVNGFTSVNNKQTGEDLGVSYTLVNSSNYKTGVVKSGETASKNGNNIVEVSAIENLKYQRTDRGLWLTLKDEYKLDESFYYYNPSSKIILQKDNGTIIPNNGSQYKDFTKVTTFTAPGYYLLRVQYQISDNASDVFTQYFAFQITATTPMLELYKTGLDMVDDNAVEGEDYFDFYAHEYTNQNVYATWRDTEIFESSITGKLYYIKGKYATESTLKTVADGGYNSSVTALDYNKNTMVKDSGSYLLVLEVERSATRTYTYFTIDKDPISGLKVYEVVTNSIDNRAIYSIKQDENLNYVSHTNSAVIDSVFTIDWNSKAKTSLTDDTVSGAEITATYKFTPFIKNNQEIVNNTITIEDGKNLYKYIINQYTVGVRSENIQINKPRRLNVELDVNNVLTDQGIYEFNLVDQAGNKLNYIVIVDRTEGVINATYGEAKAKYTSGQLVADYVELEWGTHKALDLGNVTEDSNPTIYKLLNSNQGFDDYYIDERGNNNLAKLRSMFIKGDKNIFVVQNMYTNIKLDQNANYYRLTHQGDKQIQYFNGVIYTGWDEDGNYLFANASNLGVKINVDTRDGGEDHLYNFEVMGGNQTGSTTSTKFTVRITPDEVLGQVYSTSQEGGQYDTYVNAKGMGTQYFNDSTLDENINHSKYYEGQASNDGIFVFEWEAPKDDDKFKVMEVKYNYYQLMDQEILNSISKEDVLNGKYPYYPYRYVEVSNNYILKTDENGIETISAYSANTRVTTNANGQTIESRNVNRSNAINLAYESYYNSKQELITQQVTQTGLYIITRTIVMKADQGQQATPMEYSYAFFVDRNMIIGYSINDVTSKIVGQFIHTAMPNSEDAKGVKYDNFNKQGLSNKIGTYYINNEQKTVNYKVYLETNKLPTLLQVPSGKYVSGKEDTKEISLTSYLNLELKLSVFFKDTYKILPEPYKGTFVQLMSDVTSNKDGYIDLSFSNINNPGIISIFENARIQPDDNKLSLPGEYVFMITDTVGHKLNEQFTVVDVNEFVFGIKLTNNAPVADVYAYANINNNKSDNIYSENKILYTNQEFVDFVIPVEDKTSYDAQLDIATIEVWRSDIANRPWLKLKPIAGGSGFEVDISAYIQNLDRITEVKENGRVVEYVVNLDTGITVDENNVITSYGEYTYTISVQYILTNTNSAYYQYKVGNDVISFYQTTYKVVIDRTPNSDNLDVLMAEQGDYFEEYQTWLAKQNGTTIAGDINKTSAYRNTTTLSDYYGLANNLYYQFARQSGQLSNQAMYALTVDNNSTFNPNELSGIYYRKLDFYSSIVADTRMGLLPITDIYGTGYYHSFNENMKAYTAYAISNTDFKDAYGNIYYRAVMGDDGSINSYSDNWGRFYEIIEKDMAGNLTQYVIYFAPDKSSNIDTNVNIQIQGKEIGDNEFLIQNLPFDDEANEYQRSYIGIADVKEVGRLASPSGASTSQNLYPYYGNINIYDASRELVKTIYTNSISTHNYYDGENKTLLGFEEEIFEIIKNEGNHILEYVNVFGDKKYVTINNYTSDAHRLNTATLQCLEDYQTGQNYIKFSGLNTSIDNGAYWYVTNIEISYKNSLGFEQTIKYTAGVPINGVTKLVYSAENNIAENEVFRHHIELDRLNLAPNIQYMVKFTDVGGNTYAVPISTTKGYYAYELRRPGNMYAKDDIYYTANKVNISYNTEHYIWRVEVEEDGVQSVYTWENSLDGNKHILLKEENAGYNIITLIPNTDNYYGSLRVFKVWLTLSDGEDNWDTQDPTYTIYIDTTTTSFTIKNTHEVDKIEYVQSTFKNGSDGNYQDYNLMDLINDEYYNQLLVETVNISWTRLTSDYFMYKYELFEFVNKDECVDLLLGANVNEYSIAPDDDKTTGKYILKITVEAKDGTWIASRVFGIYMSTTITGLYEVKDGFGNVYDYASITNLDEIYNDKNSFFGNSNSTSTAYALNFIKGSSGDKVAMEAVFSSFGYYTAIPMYIANTELTLHSNADNGVSGWSCRVENAYSVIQFYRIWRTNYQTFAVTMYIKPESNKNILNTLAFRTSTEGQIESLLNSGTAKTIYDKNAEFYQLTFNSYNANTKTNKLEQHNKIIIDVYYNNVYAKHVKGGDNSISTIDFKNSGSYKLEIKDTAGNLQYFSNQEYFTLVLMKKNDMLYTINDGAPIQYAYYDRAVTLQINRYNEATGKNNYDINTIKIDVKRNSVNYTGYEHPTESTTYIFRDYGTYLITMSANLLSTGEPVTAQLVFTILNPNEARNALDFTSIYGYNIISVFNISKTTEKDVTEKFISLLKDKANVDEVDVYNKLITYERVANALGMTTQGKMKLRVLYEVKNDDLLPARIIEFSFTLNNENATITSSISAGGKTTKAVTLKFNAANIYDQVGDCNLVIDGQVALRIDANSGNSITEIKVSEVGQHYVQLMGDSGNVVHSFNFTIKEPLNTVSIILIVVVSAIAIALIGTFIWLRTRMKVR